jgi:hypothetical protein
VCSSDVAVEHCEELGRSQTRRPIEDDAGLAFRRTDFVFKYTLSVSLY